MNHTSTEGATGGIYLYCLARPECLSVLHKGLAEQGDLRGVDERYPVAALEEAGVVAVIGEVDPDEFCDQNLQMLPWVGPRACRHEAVVERIMGASSVLPVKFGTIFRSRMGLKEFMNRHWKDIVRALDDLRNKAEWSIKGYLAEEEARRVVVAADPTIQSRLAALSLSPGARYLQQKQLDAMIEAALRTGVARVTHELHEVLALDAVASTTLRCHAGAMTGRPERMVYNGGFLLTHAALPGFRAVLSEQRHTHQGAGLTFELRGPWPPYNFCPAFSQGEP